MENRCPYCNQLLHRLPKRKSACPHCAQPIFVRTKQTLFPSSLLTESDVASLELFNCIGDVPDTVNPMSLGVFHTPVTEADFHDMRKRLAVRLGREPFVTETVWHLAKRASEECIRNDAPLTFYGDMARFLSKLGQDHIPVHRKHWEYQLRRYRNTGSFTSVTVRNCPGTCVQCAGQEGMKLTIDRALMSMPLPCNGCTTHMYNDSLGFCICNYEFD